MPHTIWEVGLSDLTWQLPDPCLGEDWSSARTRVQCVAAQSEECARGFLTFE